MGEQRDLFDSPGWVAAKDGMKLVSENNEAEFPGWQEHALEMLEKYLSEDVEPEFIAPDVGEWAYARGLPRPERKRAWGAVFRRASLMGLIDKAGGVRWFGNETEHTHPKILWRKCKKESMHE